MQTIIVDTIIEAPIEVCFDSARSVEIHLRTSDFTNERVVEPGRTSGLLELNDRVVFEAEHLGFRQRLTARIAEFEPPMRFVDEQEHGAFKSLRHIHEFSKIPQGTLMRDTLSWTSPFGPFGWMADRLFLRRHLTSFLRRKQQALKTYAESFVAPNYVDK